MDLKCLVIPKITENLPLKTISPSFLEIPKNISLADPKFFESSQIDLLIGAGSFWKLLCIGQVISPRGLTFQRTHFGFIAGGTFGNPEFNNTTTCNLAATIKPETNLEKQVQNFWNLEEIPSIVGDTEKLSVEEIACERHFQENTTGDSEGRFVIRLPFKNNNLTIGDTKNASLKRFYGIERKLCNDPEMKTQYSNFMSEYLDLNHMEESKIANKNECVYLPHHAVVKESSTTTKLRVVFDGSLKSSNGFSLNDNLMCGPVIQPDLFTIVVNFRTYQFVLSGDLTKMYRSVRLHPDDFKHQQIFWRSDPNEPLKSFSLTTLTYGLKPSSFIATRCLQELSNQNNESFPRESEIIRKHFYMDDLLTGSNTASELIDIKNNLVSILNQAKFELRKFQSNEPKVLPVNKSEICDPNVPLNHNENTKTLGLYWNSTTDTLKYEIKLQNISKKITKRTILSLTAQIFDPLGLVGPIIMKAKMIIQKLWSLKLGWDESIPMDLHTLWYKFTYQLNLLHQLTIPRKVITFFPHELIELHGFSDASQQGYGAAVYVRVKSTENTYETHLLCAKSRVALLKTITLPRLELCGALLLARLFEKVKQSVNLHNARKIFWTDSSIVLAWIKTPPHLLKTFVANRVTEITSLTAASKWRHISGKVNPADILSRGAFPEEIVNNHLWFSGPEFLKLDECMWPKSDLNNIVQNVPETRVAMLTTTRKILPEMPVLTKYSDLNKLQRVMAWVLRFIHNANPKNKNKLSGSVLTVHEMRNSRITIVRLIQSIHFFEELEHLRYNKPVSRKSKLLTLDPCLDENGLIRVGGRLKHANIPNDSNRLYFRKTIT
jgi:hypothetical protein